MTAGCIFDLLSLAFMVAVAVAVLDATLGGAWDRRRQERIARRGVEVEAEILARFEAGAPQGSKLARARLPYMATWDPRELELRYLFDGRAIVSRGRVSMETFFRTRSKKTLKIKVLPERPEQWTALVSLLLFLLASPALAQAPADGPPYRVGDKVTRPEKISGAPPVYLDAARKAGVTGVVILEAIIDENGDVTDVNIVKSLPEGLDQAAVDAVRTWKFKPATLDGKPVKVYYTLTVNYTMEEKEEGASRMFRDLLRENPDLDTLMRSQRLPEALAFLESRPDTPEVRVGRCFVLMALRRFDEALAEARAYDGPDPDQILHFVAVIALQTLDRPFLGEEAHAGILDVGIQAAADALALREDYRQAMRTKSRLLREKAELAVDPQRAALLYEADELEKRAAASP